MLASLRNVDFLLPDVCVTAAEGAGVAAGAAGTGAADRGLEEALPFPLTSFLDQTLTMANSSSDPKAKASDTDIQTSMALM